MSAEVRDPFDARRPVAGTGLLRQLADATVLASADVRTALVLGGLVDEPIGDDVLLAAALAVRAVRLGHVYVDLATIETTAAPEDEDALELLAVVEWPAPAAWVTAVAACPLTADGTTTDPCPLRLDGTRLYLDRYWRHERLVVRDLLSRAGTTDIVVDELALAEGLARLFPTAEDGDLQRRAATTAVHRRLSVLAGGPGTGKTTTVARTLALLQEQAIALGQSPPRVALAAPTGKAAARLAEAVHFEAGRLDVSDEVRDALRSATASTIHRLLGFDWRNRSRFRHRAENQLPHGVVVVDESSMVSLSLMAKLLDAVRPAARLLLVGDPRQLASVEAGAVLGDIVGPLGATGPLDGAVVTLTKNHRFDGGIAAVARAVESGDGDAVVDALRGAKDVTWIEDGAHLDLDRSAALGPVREEIVATAASVLDAARAGDGALALSRQRDVQVLCAHRAGPSGATHWRSEIERWLRRELPGAGTGTIAVGRPLIVTENDHGLGVWNGDTGVIVERAGRLVAVFERTGGPLEVRPTRLQSYEPLYAMTIHKAQGSQFTHVVVVLPDPPSPVLTRELLYTGLTRAQEQVTLVATEAAVRAAVGRPVQRASGLADALWTVA